MLQGQHGIFQFLDLYDNIEIVVLFFNAEEFWTYSSTTGLMYRTLFFHSLKHKVNRINCPVIILLHIDVNGSFQCVLPVTDTLFAMLTDAIRTQPQPAPR